MFHNNDISHKILKTEITRVECDFYASRVKVLKKILILKGGITLKKA